MPNTPLVFASREDAVDAMIDHGPYKKADRDALMVMSDRTFRILLRDSMKTRDKVYNDAANEIEAEDDKPVTEDSLIRSAISTARGRVRRPFRGAGDKDPAVEAMAVGAMGTSGHPKFGKQGIENVERLHAARNRAADYSTESSRRPRPQGEAITDHVAEAMTSPTTASLMKVRGKK